MRSDEGFFALASDDQVVAAVQQQVDGMRAAGYGGSEIGRLTATYLVTGGAAGRRISVLAVHSP